MERKRKKSMEDWKVAALLMLGLWLVAATSEGQVVLPQLWNQMLLVIPIGMWIVMTIRGRRSKKTKSTDNASSGD